VVVGWQYFRACLAASAASSVRPAYMGMLATVINALALQDALEKLGVANARPKRHHHGPRSRRHSFGARRTPFAKGRVVIFGGAPGNPYFSTDTARLARKRDWGGSDPESRRKWTVFNDSDPRKTTTQKFSQINLLEACKKQLKVMDSTAFSLCMDNKMPSSFSTSSGPTFKARRVG